MDQFKKYVIDNFEQFFILGILLFTAFINYFVDEKIAFLNFYFLPVILAAYYLGARKAIIGTMLAIFMVTVYVTVDTEKFLVQYNNLQLYLHIVVWGSFLLLAAAVVGQLREKLKKHIDGILILNSNLKKNQHALNEANQALKSHSEDLESKVLDRTKELENSKVAIEKLKTKVESTLYATMDATIAKLIIEGRLRTEKRKISILFSDIIGFTSYSEENSPEIVVKNLNEYISLMEPIILGFHGHIDKYMGDGIMCEFGAPIDYENYRVMAVLTALKMQEKMKEANLPWEIRVGVGSGLAITGLIGSKRQSYTSIGDVVNIASRLEANCPQGGVLIDEYTYEGCKKFFDIEEFNLNGETEEDKRNKEQILELHQSLQQSQDNTFKAAISERIAYLYIELVDLENAKKFFEYSLKLDPQNVKYKIALADLMMTFDQNSKKLKLKGKKESVKAYKVLKLKDSLDDYKKISPELKNQYQDIVNNISFPYDAILGTEALDGSIGHSRIVALLSYAIAKKMTEFDKEHDNILLAAYTADLGKEIIPHHILNRKGTLSSSEMEEVKKHPAESIRKMKSLGYDNENVLKIIRHTHEKMDGSGYPDGLSGEEIPLGSRIIAVADAYDSLTSSRPYREAWNVEAAISEIKKSLDNNHYDKDVVATLIDVLYEHEATVLDKKPIINDAS